MAIGLGLTSPAYAEIEIDFLGELTGWGVVTQNEKDENEVGLRYLPKLALYSPVFDGLDFDFEAIANFYGINNSVENEDDEYTHDEKAYRLWARLYTEQFEARLGLQELSFGPGKILRSLRWFDQKDSRDPANFTDGVRALLLRYYLENNTNFWFWSLYQNDDPMGISRLATYPDTPEFGGRIQLPIGSGEAGLSLHQREVNLFSILGDSFLDEDKTEEKRFGFDISWDLDMGIYVEVSFLELGANPVFPENQIYMTMGADYTFNVGNGLSSIVEIMGVEMRSNPEGPYDGTYWVLSLSEQYPLNLLDSIQVLAFHDFESGTSNMQTAWKRIYDNLILNAILFYTLAADDESGAGFQNHLSSGSTDEKGFRLLIQYNH